MSLVEIKKLPIGCEVLVGIDEQYICDMNYAKGIFNVRIVGRFEGQQEERCVAWVKTPRSVHIIGMSMERDIKGWQTSMRYSMLPDKELSKYTHYKWLHGNTMVDFDTVVINKDQVCVICKLPAPHAKPNVGNGFLCVSCKVLDDIGTEQLRLDELVIRG